MARGGVRTALAVVLLAAGGVACGSGTSAHDSPRPPGETPEAAVAGAERYARGITSLRYRVTGTVPGQGAVAAEVSLRTRPSAMVMRLTALGGRGPGEVRFVDGAMYADAGALAPGKAAGRTWVRAEPGVWGRGSLDNRSYGVLPRSSKRVPSSSPRS
ncbi:hypothetical protein ACGFZL_13140 [Streptomyces sp. NPDC048182]|uniref:hypothetical protein n=1 Tax=Streptomyces sp. NPDC048182 TaxID=3365507 RepID=UPI003713D368